MTNSIKNLYIKVENRPCLKDQPIEIIERKGIGHPDSFCDALVEAASIALNQLYLKHTDHILHYNLDKGLLAAGKAEPAFGGGKILLPIKMIMGDRASFQYLDKELPIWETVVKTAREWIGKNFRYLDPQVHFIFQNELRQGSSELISIFTQEKKILLANDTSAAVGFAPQTPTEKLILDIEEYLASDYVKMRFPGLGEDIKIMAIRKERAIDLTIAIAMVDRFIINEKDYFEQKEAIKNELINFIQPEPGNIPLTVNINTLDQPGKGIDGLYLTVTGTSAEQGDSGQVGRGNRVNGLICLHRPQSSEAASGKNPVSHVGKIYNYLSYLLAESIYLELEKTAGISVWLTSRIGEPINCPSTVAIEIVPEKGKTLMKGYQEIISSVINRHLGRLPEFCKDLIEGKFFKP